ncbi:MAG: gluconokinase [Desulfobacterales bacterium]
MTHFADEMQSNSPVIPAHLVDGPLVLSIDIGTSAVKILLFDTLGRAVEDHQFRQSISLQTSQDGAAEANPVEILDVVWQGIDAVLEASALIVSKIVAVAVCTFVGNIMGVDRKAKPLTPVYTYADTRAKKEAVRLRTELDERAIHDRTGCHLHASYLPARFRWLAKSRPDIFSQVDRWWSIGEYIEFVLFGEATVSYSVASWSGLLDRHRLVWDETLLQRLAVDINQLSPLVDITSPKQGLCRKFASRWPALKDLPWLSAVGDGAAANIGSGCMSPSRVALTMGSTTAIRVVVEQPIQRVPDGLWCYRIDSRRSLPGGALNEGGSLYAWMGDTLQLEDPAILETKLSSLAADGHGLTVLPFLAGERSPGWRGHARATIHGISQATSSLEILQAGMEAVACRIALVFQRLSQLLPDNVKIMAGGGAIQNSPAWLQIITNVLGQEITVSGVREGSARGAALLAFETLGIIKKLRDIPLFDDQTYFPDAQRSAVYRQTIDRQQRLYEKLMENDR